MQTIEITYRHKELFFILEDAKCHVLQYPFMGEIIPKLEAANV